MCGIAGILRTERSARVEPGVLEAMAESLAHRGPDDEGFHVSGGLGLAHRRLAIVDVSHGHQPLANEDGSVVVVFNGEIYNHDDLRAGLQAKGHRFATRCDTEAIVHAYEERGADCVEDFRGMFAFALWDERRRRLLLARDRLGIKPLYYYAKPGLLVFASEIKALLTHPDVPREIDPEALDLYLSLRYVPGPRTLFRGICKLQPGHVLVHEGDGPRLRRYWQVPAEEPEAAPDPRETVQRFTELLEESVRLRLMSEVPLGVFLSGGLDSTAVLSVLARQAEGLATFTVGYGPAPDGRSGEDDEANEFAFARMAAQAYGTDHHEVRITDTDFQDFLPDLAWHLDEPVADPACVPLYFVSREARRDVTVVLSGEGADEILGGYSIYRRMLALERLHRGLGPLAGLAEQASPLLPGERLRHAARLAGMPLTRRYRGVSRGFLPEGKARLLGIGGASRAERAECNLLELLAERSDGDGSLERMLRLDLGTWLPDDLLVKADKMTMANSQELRVPFLDHRLVEMAARLPASYKVDDGVGKVLLRRAMEGRVPSPILERTKKGFPVPTVPLLRRLGGYTRDLLLDRGAACRDWFDAAYVERLLDEHRSGRARRDQEIWTLMLFELWHGVFLDGRFTPAAAAATAGSDPRPGRGQASPLHASSAAGPPTRVGEGKACPERAKRVERAPSRAGGGGRKETTWS